MDLDEYISRGSKLQYFPDWDLRLQNASTVYRLSRLEALEIQLRQQIEEVYSKFNSGMRSQMGDIFAEGFSRNLYEVQRATGLAISQVNSNTDPFAALNTKKIEAVLTRPWAPDGTNFSEKIWKDRNGLVDYLNRELTQSFIRGEGPDRLIRELKEKFDVTSKQAARLVQTESAYFSTMSKIESYKEMGFTKYTILAVMDAKTSEICMEMDGEVFDIEDMKVGDNAPPFHPNCRTTIAPYADTGNEDERSHGLLRDPDSGEMYSVPRDMTYGEWYEKYVKAKENVVESSLDIGYNDDMKLTNDELHAINSYISDESYVINEKLRYDMPLSRDDVWHIANLDTALEKMPFYSGDISRSLYLEGQRLEDFLGHHTVDKEILVKSYTSFTYGDTYNPEARVQIHILDSSKGRDISMFNKDENEIIYPRNTRFWIIDILEDDGYYDMFLEEV